MRMIFKHNFFKHFLIIADSDASEIETMQDILICGSCQTKFTLGDIVNFIQHKVLQCNKENYGQCYQQGNMSYNNVLSA